MGLLQNKPPITHGLMGHSFGGGAPGGNGATLDLNFLSGALDGRITFTRASSATFVGSNGLIQTASTDIPRFDYDPVTLAIRGLLIEEARTNLLLNSTIDGANLATQSVTVAAVAHTLSFYGTGTVTLTGASTAGPLVGSGVYPARSTLTFTPSAGSLTLTVTGTVQFANLEAGAFPTSYIPTAGSSVTRAIDSALASISDIWGTGGGTVAFEATRFSNDIVQRQWMSFQPNTERWAEMTVTDGAIDRPEVRIDAGGSMRFAVAIVPLETALGTLQKRASALAANDYACSVNGLSVYTNTTAGVMPSPTHLRIGAGPFNTAQICGHIRRIRYWNTRLPNATLQALTA